MKSTSIRTRTSVAYAAVALIAVVSLSGIAHADLLTRQLEQGMTGADVSTLQTFLARDITIYPQGLVTGFFGPLTFSAVSNFQSKNGIATVGRVGPITRAAINARLAGGNTPTGDRSGPGISSINVAISGSSTRITWNTNENAVGKLYYDVTQIGMAGDTGAIPETVSVTGTKVESVTPGFGVSHVVNLPNLAANTTYFYVIHVTDQSGNVSVSWPTTFKTSN